MNIEIIKRTSTNITSEGSGMLQNLHETFPPPKRRQHIYELLKEKEALSVEELREMFRVSSMTIRRDLEALEEEGKLNRTRGGAEKVRTPEYEPSYHVRVRENQKEKLAIARKACELVKDGDVIIIDIGSTLLSFCQVLCEKSGVTAITNWIPNVLELAKNPKVRTVLLGGTLRNAELSLVGGMTRDMLSSFNADKAFIGIGGLSHDKGLTDYNMDEVELKRAMISAAREVVVLADHTKIERVAPISICPFGSINTLIVDDGVEERHLDMLRSQGINLLVADTGGNSH